jgi:NADH dehydrogenase [ubiquinone] 1 alpha subcomplex assembly factor 1
MAGPEAALLLSDFGDAGAVQAWQALDDRVMGGLSRSRLRHDPAGHAVFEGEVSLERNGGFASVRGRPGPRGRPGAQACLIEVRGDGRAFKLSLFTEDTVDALQHQARFVAPSAAWQTLRLPLAAFIPTFRGREVHGAPALDPARIRQLGLMTAGREQGRFALAIRHISLV